MNILGLNAFHGDAAAALLSDGAFFAGIEEERLNRVKHWAGFPARAVASVLEQRAASLAEVDHIAVSRDPKAHLIEKALFAFRHRPGLDAIRARLANHRRIGDLGELVGSRLADLGKFNGQIHNVEHHRAHLASSYFCSPFDDAACLTIDGFGDFLSSMSAVGTGNHLEVLDEVSFPHSLGIFYTAITQFIGFPKYGDEYKVMGLASYGRASYLPQMRDIVHLTDEGGFKVNLDYFRHASEGITMSWDDGEPTLGPLWSTRLEEALGPARRPGDPLGDREQDIAASLQAMYEEAFFHRLRWLQKKTGKRALCLAGGCAMNSVANGKIFRRTDFRDVFIQSAAGDAGTSLGAALYVWHETLGKPRSFRMEHSFWGPEFSDGDIRAAIGLRVAGFDAAQAEAGMRVGDLHIQRIADEEHLATDTAARIANGKVVGWFQGRTEWGPRALGNRSILADPRRADMKDVLNARIKRRESFRPFAPSILEEHVSDYFEESYPDPFMIKVYPIRASRRPEIPAVTHVDGTGRLQTVSREHNARYWGLIKAFHSATGVPLVLNTSFNENEPIVNTPAEALDCFLRTRMDRLALGTWVLDRVES